MLAYGKGGYNGKKGSFASFILFLLYLFRARGLGMQFITSII